MLLYQWKCSIYSDCHLARTGYRGETSGWGRSLPFHFHTHVFSNLATAIGDSDTHFNNPGLWDGSFTGFLLQIAFCWLDQKESIKL